MAASLSAEFTNVMDAATTITVSNVTSTSGDLLVAVLILYVDEADQAAISDSQTLTWTERIADTSADNINMRVWTAPANGTTTNVTVDSWTTGSRGSLFVADVTGTDQTTGATASAHTNGNSKLLAVTITTNNSDSLLYIVHGGDGDEGAGIIPTGFTTGANTEPSGNDGEGQSAYKTSAGGSDNHTWGDNTVFILDRTAIAIEINASGGAPVAAPVIRRLAMMGVGR